MLLLSLKWLVYVKKTSRHSQLGDTGMGAGGLLNDWAGCCDSISEFQREGMVPIQPLPGIGS